MRAFVLIAILALLAGCGQTVGFGGLPAYGSIPLGPFGQVVCSPAIHDHCAGNFYSSWNNLGNQQTAGYGSENY